MGMIVEFAGFFIICFVIAEVAWVLGYDAGREEEDDGK